MTNTYIHQFLLDKLEKIDFPNKALILYGPRRVGKTTLLHKLLEKKKDYLFVSGEDIDVQHYLSTQSIAKLKTFIGEKKHIRIHNFLW
jgi:uncharacterized protein